MDTVEILMAFPDITIAIPTYGREQVLLDTIDQLLALQTKPSEILVMDQTPAHDPETEERLQSLDAEGRLRWVRIAEPSIPEAMNRALLEAEGDIVLFLDDDVDLTSEIVAAHAEAHREHHVPLVAGQVVQSWQTALSEDDESYAEGSEDDPDRFLFHSSRICFVDRFMGGNFSIQKDIALSLGGFDENFVRVAYNFEAEFADRLRASGQRILFYPQASIRHLKAESGGTRTFGEHLTTFLPSHAVGRYYYLLVARNIPHRRRKIVTGPFRSVMTRFHLYHPWWILPSFIAECGGVVWAMWLYVRGPRYIGR